MTSDGYPLPPCSPPPSLISPAITPPSTPGTSTPTPRHLRDAPSEPIPPLDSPLPSRRSGPTSAPSAQTSPSPASSAPQKLLSRLPTVTCEVRARIPTVAGQEMFLHLYHNDIDDKEHLAIVFGSEIRSRSLDAPRPGETERDRLIRGAYVGRLRPGRTSSRVDGDWEGRYEDGETGMEEARRAEKKDKLPLVRIHSECYTGETVWSARCDCGEQLDEAARLMTLDCNREAGAVIIYLRQEGRGIGLGEKLKAYNLQDLGHDTAEANELLRHPADARTYGLATAMLMDLGLGGDEGIRLLTNNMEKVRAVEGPGGEVKVRERVAMVPLAWRTGGKVGIKSVELDRYLATKIEKFNHRIRD